MAAEVEKLYPRSSFSDSEVLFSPTAWAQMGNALALQCKNKEEEERRKKKKKKEERRKKKEE
jgi:hypothetical protein